MKCFQLTLLSLDLFHPSLEPGLIEGHQGKKLFSAVCAGEKETREVGTVRAPNAKGIAYISRTEKRYHQPHPSSDGDPEP